MKKFGRRTLLASAAALGGSAAAAVVSSGYATAQTGDGQGSACTGGFGKISVNPSDVQYDGLVQGVFNQRFVGNPDSVRLVDNTSDVVVSVQDAVHAGRRLAVRSGGHCYEDFTGNPAIRLVIDMSQMHNIYYDARANAVAVETGAKLAQVYQALFKVFGTTVPGGSCPTVGVGGHFIGGGYGLLSRQLGSVVDYIYGVEVVVVDQDSQVRVITATRDESDPNRDLWWAHTGGGGGNFGVVTRLLLRSPDATGTDPTLLLPRSAAAYFGRSLTWNAGQLSERAVTGILGNFGTWLEHNSAPDSPAATLCPVIFTTGIATPGRATQAPLMTVSVTADPRDRKAGQLVDEFFAAAMAGITAPPPQAQQGLTSVLSDPSTNEQGGQDEGRFKAKAAYHRKGFTEAQLTTIYQYLSAPRTYPSAINLLLFGYGGRVNAIAPDATATAQRDSVFKAVYSTAWNGTANDAAGVLLAQHWYRDVYTGSGGVPVPNTQTDGSYINYPDVDLADPAWNTSGVPWHTLYYKDNYTRLQRIKSSWDPGNLFHHNLSIEPS